MKIVFSISPHGFGHAAQTSSVVNHLLQCRPDVNICIKTSLAADVIRGQFNAKVELSPHLIDFGMVMASSIDILAEESWVRYKALHDTWDTCVAQEMDDLRRLGAQLVVSNVSYFTLEAAKQMTLPSIAMSSLNWADIFDHYCHRYPDAQKITQRMRAAYNSAQTFIQFTPCLPMPWLVNRNPVSPITRLGMNKRDQIKRTLNLHPETDVILIGLGGIEMRLPIEAWPTRPRTHWIVPDSWATQRKDCSPLSAIALPFIDILASADALITKPGYGTFSEAVCNKVPFLYVLRGDWPEEPYLEAWARQFGSAASITRDGLYKGMFFDALDVLLRNKHQNSPPIAAGAQEAVDIILATLNKV